MQKLSNNDITVTLVADDKSIEQVASFRFESKEWETIQSFHEDVELLRSTSFVQKKRGGAISLSWSQGSSIISKAKQVPLEEFWAMILKLRPFVLSQEKHYFHKFKNLLKRRLDHPVFRNDIMAIHEAFMLKRMKKNIRITGVGRSPMSVEVVMDWLNSYEYHKDENKRIAVAHDLGFFGTDQDGLPIILFALVDMIQAVLGLGDLAEGLLAVKKGDLEVFTSPVAYFTETYNMAE